MFISWNALASLASSSATSVANFNSASAVALPSTVAPSSFICAEQRRDLAAAVERHLGHRLAGDHLRQHRPATSPFGAGTCRVSRAPSPPEFESTRRPWRRLPEADSSFAASFTTAADIASAVAAIQLIGESRMTLQTDQRTDHEERRHRACRRPRGRRSASIGRSLSSAALAGAGRPPARSHTSSSSMPRIKIAL